MTDDISQVLNLGAAAAADPALRERLLADPAGTITAETGQEIPEDLTIVATENPDGSVTLALAEGAIPDDLLAGLSAGCGGSGGGDGRILKKL